MIRIQARTPDGSRRDAVPVDELSVLSDSKDTLTWIDLEAAPPEEIAQTGAALGWDGLTIEDLTGQRERVKLEHFETYLYLVMHALIYEGTPPRLTTPQMHLIIGSNYVASVHADPLPSLSESEEAANTGGRMLARGPDYLLFELVDQLVDSYFPALDAMNSAVDDLEEQILTDASQNLMPRIFEMKRDAVALRRAVSPQMEVFTRLMGPSTGIVTDACAVYFRDVYDHLVRVFDEADSYRDLMSGVLDAYLSTVSNRMNQVMQRLTVLAALFLPVTFLTGLFGMNLRKTPLWTDPLFWVFLIVMLVISVGQFLYFRRRRWA